MTGVSPPFSEGGEIKEKNLFKIAFLLPRDRHAATDLLYRCSAVPTQNNVLLCAFKSLRNDPCFNVTPASNAGKINVSPLLPPNIDGRMFFFDLNRNTTILFN